MSPKDVVFPPFPNKLPQWHISHFVQVSVCVSLLSTFIFFSSLGHFIVPRPDLGKNALALTFSGTMHIISWVSSEVVVESWGLFRMFTAVVSCESRSYLLLPMLRDMLSFSCTFLVSRCRAAAPNDQCWWLKLSRLLRRGEKTFELMA